MNARLIPEEGRFIRYPPARISGMSGLRAVVVAICNDRVYLLQIAMQQVSS